MSMATEAQHTSTRRRRSRPIAFFDHGERDDHFRQVRFVIPPSDAHDTERRLERGLPFLRYALHTTTWILASLAILGPTILILASGVRGVQLLCSYQLLNESNPLCNNTWTKPQTTLLQRLPEGTTPLSAIFRELGELQSLHTSVEFMGLPLFTIVQNLTTILPEVEQKYGDDSGVMSSIESLRLAVGSSNEFVEALGNLDYDFRQVFLWNPEAANDFVGSIEGLLGVMNNRSEVMLSAQEAVLHIMPLASEHSFSYSTAKQYLAFFNVHHTKVEQLAKLSIETKLVLQEAIGYFGQLERALVKARLHIHADEITFMRLSSRWVESVVQDIETRYRNIHHSLQKMRNALQADIATYDAWWLSTSYVPVSKLRHILSTEMTQMTAFETKSMKVTERTNDMYQDMLSEDSGLNRFRSQLEAGILNNEANWYTSSDEE